jgi:hypothetical protein
MSYKAGRSLVVQEFSLPNTILNNHGGELWREGKTVFHRSVLSPRDVFFSERLSFSDSLPIKKTTIGTYCFFSSKFYLRVEDLLCHLRCKDIDGDNHHQRKKKYNRQRLKPKGPRKRGERQHKRRTNNRERCNGQILPRLTSEKGPPAADNQHNNGSRNHRLNKPTGSE